jgi:putative ABC transport system permease protein
MVKNKVLSLVNMLSLAIGMAAFLLIFLYVSYEKSYDDFHANADHTYRVYQYWYKEGKLTRIIPNNPSPLGPTIKDKFPEVKEFVRLIAIGDSNFVTYKDNALRVKNLYFVDPSILSVFSVTLVKGNPVTVLNEPTDALVSETYAKNLFGNQDPMDKTFIFKGPEGDMNYTIKGVFKDLPGNSHLQFDFLLSNKYLLEHKLFKDNWGRFAFKLYLLLRPKSNVTLLEEKINKHTGEIYKGVAFKFVFALQPLKKIHLYSGHIQSDAIRGSYRTVHIFTLIALFVLIVGWLNYVIITTARAMSRAGEVGIKKVLGAARRQLIQQFLFESLLFNILAAITALILVKILLPYFNHLFGLQLGMSVLGQVTVWLPAFVLFVGGAFLSGIYPAFILSSYKPVSILAGKLKSSTSGKFLRKLLAVFQITLSVILIAATLSIYKQISYMNSQDLGINLDQVMLILNPTYMRYQDKDSVVRKGQAFVGELKKYSEIKGISSSNVPGTPYFSRDFVKTEGGIAEYHIKFAIIDSQFLDTYDARLIAGRNLSEEFSEDRGGSPKSILINKKAAKILGFDSPEKALHQILESASHKYRVVGVLEDFHHMYLKEAIEATGFEMNPYSPHQYLSIKLDTGDLSRTIDLVQLKYKKYFLDYPFEYKFARDMYDRQYQTERQFGKIFGVYAILSIFIACIGLWSLSLYAVSTRTKEIGIRKVFGATSTGIFSLISQDYVRLTLIANIIALPIAYFAAMKWLGSYAYRIEIGWWFFVVPAAITLLSALMTVSYHVYKIATSNPVDSVRYE